jgi:hypothetical protein
VAFENVNISAAKGFLIRNARSVKFKDSVVSVAAGDAFVADNAIVTGLASGK